MISILRKVGNLFTRKQMRNIGIAIAVISLIGMML